MREFVVYEGRPSWHQQRAGHIAGASSVFTTRKKAEDHMARMLKVWTDVPIFIIEREKESP